MFCSGLRLTHKLNRWDNITVYTLTQEYTLNDYTSIYIDVGKNSLKTQKRQQKQINISLPIFPILHAKIPKEAGIFPWACVKNSKFLNRLSKKAQNSKIDIINFLITQVKQFGYFKHVSLPLHPIVYKLPMQETADDINSYLIKQFKLYI